MAEDFDVSELEWGDDLERFTRVSTSKADVSASRSLWGKTAVDPKVRTILVFRNSLVEWFEENGPRFSVNLDSTRMHLRITPNSEAGRFEFTKFKTVILFRMGYVKELPNTTFEAADGVVHLVEKKKGEKPFLAVRFPKDWLTGKQLLLPAPVKETKVEDGIPAGIRKVLNLLSTTESVSHSFLPGALEMSREDTRRWLDDSKKWLAGLKPPIILHDQKFSYFLTRPDSVRVKKLLEG